MGRKLGLACSCAVARVGERLKRLVVEPGPPVARRRENTGRLRS